MVVINEVALLLNIKYSYLVYPTITMVLGNKAIVGAVSVSPSLSFQRYKTSSWIFHLYLRCCVLEADATADVPAEQALLVQTRGAGVIHTFTHQVLTQKSL